MQKQQPDQYLTSEEIKEFQELYFAVKNVKLSPEEAEDQGTRLIRLFEAMQKFEPIPMSFKDAVEMMRMRQDDTS